jgi:hypothetical protein
MKSTHLFITISLMTILLCQCGSTNAQILTAQIDNSRTGANLHETILTPSNVSVRSFGKLYSWHVDGDIFAQPLYVPQLYIPGKGIHNVVFVATEHDSVYAFDSAVRAGAPLWKVHFISPREGATTVPADDVHCPFINPEIGITPTPVIDLSSGTIYLLVRTKENGAYVQRIHALNLATGKEQPYSPVTIRATVEGSGEGSVGKTLSFDPLKENPRAALLLAGNELYLTWASSCDDGPYHGWVMAYEARTLKQTAVLNTTPDGGEGGIWQSDAAPAADDEGNIFVVTGNGDFNASVPNGRDFGDSVLKLHLDGHRLVIRDYFTPFNQKFLNTHDLDLGSQGPVLLPKQLGSHHNLLIVAGKEGKLYVLDRDQMGRYHASSDGQIIQSIKLEAGYGAAAYWNRYIYYSDCCDFVTRSFEISNGLLRAGAATNRMGSIGGIPSVSASGLRDGILWIVSTKEWNQSRINKPAVLHAYDATDISHELYNSEQFRTRDDAGMTVRFATPTIADGYVFIATRGQLNVYGLLKPIAHSSR